MEKRTLMTAALVAILALALTACGGGSTPTTGGSTGSETTASGETTTDGSEETVVEEPTEEETVLFGPSSFEGLFRLSVNYALPNPNPNDDTTRLLNVQGGVANNSDAEVIIARESLFVADEEGVRYYADEPDERTRPPLVGTALRAKFSGFGVVRFTVPVDANIKYFGWCPDNTDCPDPLVVEILR